MATTTVATMIAAGKVQRTPEEQRRMDREADLRATDETIATYRRMFRACDSVEVRRLLFRALLDLGRMRRELEREAGRCQS